MPLESSPGSKLSSKRRKRIKRRLLEIYGNICQRCLTYINMTLPSDHYRGWSIDHIDPDEGKTTYNHISNLQPMHKRCNELKGNKSNA